MNGKKKKILLGTGIVCGAALLALGGYALSLVGKDELYSDADYGEWVVTSAPTCEEKGAETRALLSSPKVTQTRDIPALGHDWGEWEQDTLPTCTAGGANKRKCANCHNYDYDPVPATGHEWGEWETARAATCLVAGYDKRICNRDGAHVDLRIVEATGHDWSEWTVLVAPACTEAGLEQRVCRYDNIHTQQRGVPALGHDWNDPVVTEVPTCTSKGTLTSVCRNDSLHTESEPVPALGHDWGEWVVTAAPTYFEEGEEMRICANDSSHAETNVLPILMNAELDYILNRDGVSYSVRLNNPDEAIGTVEIPATHEGLPVTKIDNNGFKFSQLSRVVVLGDNLETIGDSAFSNSPMLEEVVITGGSLKDIGSSAFYKCPALESFTIPEGVEEVGNYLFRGCTNLKSLSIPASLALLSFNPWSVVSNCPALEEITVAEGNTVYRSENNCLIERATNTLLLGTKNSVIPNGVTAIGSHAFVNREIERIVIPESVTVIGNSAFSACHMLTELEISDSVEEIGGSAFDGCTGLTSIAFPASLVKLGGNEDSLYVSNVVRGCTALESITISDENSVFRVENNCMIERESNVLLFGIKNSVIPEGVTAIGESAFAESAIESVVIPASVTSIEANAFASCKELISVTFADESVENISHGAFRNCFALMQIEIPASVSMMKDSVFENWKQEQKVFIKGFAYEEDADAAWGSDWRQFTNATISYVAEVDGQLTFSLYSNSSAYKVKARRRDITGTVTIPATYKGIPVTQISDNAFMNCTELTSIVVLGNIESIGNNAFYNCVNLESFVVPEGVTKIGNNAFCQCESLISVSLPASLTTLGSCPFKDCSALETVTVAEENEVFYSESGCLIERATNILIAGTKNAVIPASVTGIGDYAFSQRTNESIVIPTGVTGIGYKAFDGWTQEQTIIVMGLAFEEEAVAAWGANWLSGCNATIIYAKEDSEL